MCIFRIAVAFLSYGFLGFGRLGCKRRGPAPRAVNPQQQGRGVRRCEVKTHAVYLWKTFFTAAGLRNITVNEIKA